MAASGIRVDISGTAGAGGVHSAYASGSSGGASVQGYAGGFGGAGGNGYAGGGFGGAVAQAALNDPGIQQQLKEAAYYQAQQGLQVAKEGAVQAVHELKHYVQEGPAGISILCFLGGLATTVVGFLGLLSIPDGITKPLHYVLNAYLTVFGVVTFLLEADLDSVKKLRCIGRLAPWIERYQQEVFTRAQFLTELRGRGFFYLFVGTLAITQCFICLLFLVGLWNGCMGILCLLMSFGINPAHHIPLAQEAEPHAERDPPLLLQGHA